MNRLCKLGLLGLTAVFFLTACNSSKQEEEATTEAKSDEIVIDYSAGLTKEGILDGITASELVTVCEYKNIEIPKDEVDPSDDDVEDQIENLLTNYGEYEGQAEEKDTVNIDYVGKIDGEEFSGGTASGQSLEIGSHTFIDSFEEQIIGHEPGETFDVEVTFPSDYASEEVAGKDAVFQVTLNYIVPELTDDFVAENFSESNGISTVKELKKAIKENLRTSNENTYLWDYLLTNSTFHEIPEDVMESRLEVSLNILRKQYHDYMGYDDEQIMNMYDCESMEEVKENLRSDTEKSVKYYILSAVISEKENLKVDDTALEHYLGEENVSAYNEAYGEPYVNAQVLISVVSDFLIENATLK